MFPTSGRTQERKFASIFKLKMTVATGEKTKIPSLSEGEKFRLTQKLEKEFGMKEFAGSPLEDLTLGELRTLLDRKEKEKAGTDQEAFPDWPI